MLKHSIQLGAAHERRPQYGGFVLCGHFAEMEGRVLQMRTSVLFDAKNIGLFEIYDVSVRAEGGVEPVRTRGERE